MLHEAGVPAEALRASARRGRGRRGDRRRPARAGRRLHRLDAGRPPHRKRARRAPDPQRAQPVPLIAETGGLNAMVVDSSALPEQVVADVMSSAFDSAGQRCSALRILCLQDDVADRMLAMLKGAMAELEVGDTRKLSVDVGPVITAEARDAIRSHIEAMWGRGFAVTQARTAGSGGARDVRRSRADRGEKGRRRRARGVRPGAARAALPARGARSADRRDQRRRLRPHLRPAHPHRRDDRARRRADRGRQHLCQPQHHRRDRRRAAVRRLAPFRHRPEGGRPALSVAPRRRAPAGGADRARRRPVRAAEPARLYRLAARVGPRRGSRALRRPCLALAARRVRVELEGPVGERNVYALRRARPDRGVGREPQRRADPDRRDPRRRQRRARESGRRTGAERACRPS